MYHLAFKTYFDRTDKSSEDPLFRRTRAHAVKRIKFPAGTPMSERMPAYKEFLRLEKEMMLRYHRKGDSGLRVTQTYSIMMDVLIERLFKFAVATYKKQYDSMPCEVSVLALGGYGRNELCPYSDIDIMFLYPNRVQVGSIDSLQEVITNEILYPLWDLQLKVGHSSRNLNEAIAEAKTSMESRNALVESRKVTGNGMLYKKFVAGYKNFTLNHQPEKFVEDRLTDQEKRRSKFGNTVYRQEPDIKNGVGGLRDYQNILWTSFVKYNIKSIWDLRKHGILKKNEIKKLIDAYDFLLRVRIEVHFYHKKANDILSLEIQPEIAQNLGYKSKDMFRRVEKFMQEYFQHANYIYQTSSLLERKMAMQKKKFNIRGLLGMNKSTDEQEIDGFILEDKVLYAKHKKVFEEDPIRLIRLFRHTQSLEATLDLDLIQLVRRSLHLITNKFIELESANKTFRSILQSVGNVYPALAQMHEYGVLGKFMPEFGELTCLVQHEHYHQYTADIHVLKTIKELDHVFSASEDIYIKYRDAIRDTPIPGLLYIMLLLHDIGKSRGIKGHAEASVMISEPLLKRLGIDFQHHEQILYVIKCHFEMTRYTLKFDIDDPLTIEKFAKEIENADNLRYLYVHTFCDAKGVSDDLWSSYKDSILTQLFGKTLMHFREEGGIEAHYNTEMLEMRKRLELNPLNEVPEEEQQAHLDSVPERYYVNHSEHEIRLHMKLVHDLLMRMFAADSQQILEPVISWEDDDDQGLSVCHIVTWDRSGLFSKLTAAFTLADINILSCRLITRKDHITIDSFYLTNAKGGAVKDKKTKELFRKKLVDILMNEKSMTKEIVEAEKKIGNSLFSKAPARLQINIPTVVRVYEEKSLQCHIVEIQATDRLGLLYRIARVIYKSGFDINFARISTERDSAVDSFYIHNIIPGKKVAKSRLDKLKEELKKLLSDSAQVVTG